MTTKILAIDDSKTMRLAIKITFAAEDADVTSVSKGSDAVARAKQMGADVVLVDTALASGEPSGYEICRALKSDPGTSGIPVVLLASNQTGVDEAQMAAVGADDWVAKPFDTQELIDKVAAAKAKGSTKSTAAAAPAAAVAPPPRAASGPRPAAATPAAKPARPRAANRTQMGMPSPASTASTAATPAAAKPVPRAAAPKPPTPAPKPTPAAKPAPAPRPAARQAAATPKSAPAKPVARPAARPATPAAPSGAGAGAGIPIAIPIPFTAADAPTPGMAERIAAAAGGAGIDPKVAEALASLSRDVVERIVWEVVPELAESLIREAQAKSA